MNKKYFKSERGAGLVEGIVAFGVIGLGIAANMSLFGSSNTALRSNKSNLVFSNVKASLSASLQAKSVLLVSAKSGSPLDRCIASHGKDDCKEISNLKTDLLDPFDTKKSILAISGTKYMFDGSVADASQQKNAVFTAELDRIRAVCRRDEKEKQKQKQIQCDLASEVIIEYKLYPITSQYKILGVPDASYFCKTSSSCEGKPENMKKNFVEYGEVVVRTADFKVDENLTTDLCPTDGKMRDINGDLHLKLPSPSGKCPGGTPKNQVMVGIKKFTEDGSKGYVICRDVTFSCGAAGVKGPTGIPGRRGLKGYRSYTRYDCGNGCFNGLLPGHPNDR